VSPQLIERATRALEDKEFGARCLASHQSALADTAQIDFARETLRHRADDDSPFGELILRDRSERVVLESLHHRTIAKLAGEFTPRRESALGAILPDN